MSCGLVTQQPPPSQRPPDQKKLKTPPPKPEEEPPEEDESVKPEEFALNPLQSSKELTAGNYYFKKGNFRAAARRYVRATKWDPGSAEAFLKLGEVDEKLRDRDGEREAYTKYLALAPDARNADEIKKKLTKLPAARK